MIVLISNLTIVKVFIIENEHSTGESTTSLCLLVVLPPLICRITPPTPIVGSLVDTPMSRRLQKSLA